MYIKREIEDQILLLVKNFPGFTSFNFRDCLIQWNNHFLLIDGACFFLCHGLILFCLFL